MTYQLHGAGMQNIIGIGKAVGMSYLRICLECEEGRRQRSYLKRGPNPEMGYIHKIHPQSSTV
jgi:hypothetical protein